MYRQMLAVITVTFTVHTSALHDLELDSTHTTIAAAVGEFGIAALLGLRYVDFYRKSTAINPEHTQDNLGTLSTKPSYLGYALPVAGLATIGVADVSAWCRRKKTIVGGSTPPSQHVHAGLPTSTIAKESSLSQFIPNAWLSLQHKEYYKERLTTGFFQTFRSDVHQYAQSSIFGIAAETMRSDTNVADHIICVYNLDGPPVYYDQAAPTAVAIGTAKAFRGLSNKKILVPIERGDDSSTPSAAPIIRQERRCGASRLLPTEPLNLRAVTHNGIFYAATRHNSIMAYIIFTNIKVPDYSAIQDLGRACDTCLCYTTYQQGCGFFYLSHLCNPKQSPTAHWYLNKNVPQTGLVELTDDLQYAQNAFVSTGYRLVETNRYILLSTQTLTASEEHRIPRTLTANSVCFGSFKGRQGSGMKNVLHLTT